MSAKIAVITYTTYGHTDVLAKAVIQGVESIGATVKHFQIPETLPQEVRDKLLADPIRDIPAITPDDLKNFDGFLFGFPTRWGGAPAQVRQFFDSTGQVWFKRELIGKFASFFTGSGAQHGGQETTHLTNIPFLVHHGINYVPLGMRSPDLGKEHKVLGGSLYGASFIAGHEKRPVQEEEIRIAEAQGRAFADVVSDAVAGRAARSRPV